MSETLKTVLLNYAVCAFVGGALEYVAPERTKKTLRVAVVSVLLLGVLLPFSKNEIRIEKLFPETEIKEEINYDALMHTANLTERKIRGEMKEILINEGVNEYEIYINTTVDERENTVFLDEIKIEVGKDFEGEIADIKNKVPQEYKGVLKVGVKNE